MFERKCNYANFVGLQMSGEFRGRSILPIGNRVRGSALDMGFQRLVGFQSFMEDLFFMEELFGSEVVPLFQLDLAELVQSRRHGLDLRTLKSLRPLLLSRRC